MRLLPPDRLHLLRRPQRDRLPALVQVVRVVPDFEVLFLYLVKKFLIQEVSLLWGSEEIRENFVLGFLSCVYCPGHLCAEKFKVFDKFDLLCCFYCILFAFFV